MSSFLVRVERVVTTNLYVVADSKAEAERMAQENVLNDRHKDWVRTLNQLGQEIRITSDEGFVL